MTDLVAVNERIGPSAGGRRRFDVQAPTFDERAGIPADAAEAIADAVMGFGPCVDGSRGVLEVGAGTGEVGRHLSTRAGRYMGLDLSRPMLEVFASKVTDGNGARVLVEADADADWPLRDRSVSVVFASRAAHLLAAGHVVHEVGRVCARPGWFIVGRVERSGIKETLRRQREAMLIDRGVPAGRSGLRRTRALLETFAAVGAIAQPARTVASWTSTTTAEEVIAAWEPMAAMAGQPVDAGTRADVLAQLRRWARQELGDLERPQTYGEHYTLEGVRLG